MAEETRKPLEILCPLCGKLTNVVCYQEYVCHRTGIAYDLDDDDMEVLEASYPSYETEYSCQACSTTYDCDDLELIAESLVPMNIRLKMESRIDLFEDFWQKSNPGHSCVDQSNATNATIDE